MSNKERNETANYITRDVRNNHAKINFMRNHFAASKTDLAICKPSSIWLIWFVVNFRHFNNPFAPGYSTAMSFRSRFSLVLFCCFLLASPRSTYATENIFGSDHSDFLLGTSGIDEIFGGYGDDVLTGNDGNDLLHGGNGDDILRGGNGDDVLRGGDGDDELRGGNGDDILYGGVGVDRLYGGFGADRFVFEIDAVETDEVMDFSPGQNDTVWLQGNYSEYTYTADSVRVDNEGDLEIRLGHENWSRVVRLNNNNLELDVEEITEGLQLQFIRRF